MYIVVLFHFRDELVDSVSISGSHLRLTRKRGDYIRLKTFTYSNTSQGNLNVERKVFHRFPSVKFFGITNMTFKHMYIQETVKELFFRLYFHFYMFYLFLLYTISILVLVFGSLLTVVVILSVTDLGNLNSSL